MKRYHLDRVTILEADTIDISWASGQSYRFFATKKITVVACQYDAANDILYVEDDLGGLHYAARGKPLTPSGWLAIEIMVAA